MSSGPVVATDYISVLLADSNQMESQLLVAALRRRPEFRVNCCSIVFDAIRATIAAVPCHVLILVPEQKHGLAPDLSIVRRVHLEQPGIATILLVNHFDRDLVVNAFRAGVRGLFSFAESRFRLLCRCIHSVHHGQVWANSEQLTYLLEEITQVPSLRVVNVHQDNRLTPREEQVVALVAEGLGNRDIARELELSEHTVKKYLFRIFDKLGISSRVELVLYAVSHSDTRNAEWIPGSQA
jgi:DNA-binding NarL/FixJ family response regulator